MSSSLEGALDAERVYEVVRIIKSISGSALRNTEDMKNALSVIDGYLSSFSSIRAVSQGRIWNLFQLRNSLITPKVYLSSMIETGERKEGSSGSAIYSDKDGEIRPRNLDDRFVYNLEKEEDRVIQEVRYVKGKVEFSYRKPRPIPVDDNFFENVWRGYGENKNTF